MNVISIYIYFNLILAPPAMESPRFNKEMSSRNDLVIDLFRASEMHGPIKEYFLYVLPIELSQIHKPEFFTQVQYIICKIELTVQLLCVNIQDENALQVEVQGIDDMI